MPTLQERLAKRVASARTQRSEERASVVYWGRKAGTKRGREMLERARVRYAAADRKLSAAERSQARHRAATTVSAAGTAAVAIYEGWSSKPYWDPNGHVWTRGYGRTYGITAHSPSITKAQGAVELRRGLTTYVQPLLALCREIGLTLTQNELDALASFMWNLGTGSIGPGWTMGQALRSKNKARIRAAFTTRSYTMSGGEFLPGLVARRRSEAARFGRG